MRQAAIMGIAMEGESETGAEEEVLPDYNQSNCRPTIATKQICLVILQKVATIMVSEPLPLYQEFQPLNMRS